ncbi:MAG: ParA family protein [Oribacterium sp.]|nr:ParA family protein [Oribacterium sp.]
MATVFVVANQKGGIGKSTTATNLAGILGKQAKTLLIDADPQGNSSSTYDAKIEDAATLYDVIIDSDKLPISEAIQHTENGDIVASDPLLVKAEKMLDGDLEGFYRLKDALEGLDGYEYIVIDTAPSLNIILYNCLIAADKVIIPVTADSYAIQGIQQLHDTIMSVKKRQNRELTIEGLLLVRYSGRSNLEKETREDIRKTAEKMDTRLFNTVIRECIKTKEAQEHKKLLIDFAPRCNTCLDYIEFVKELV